MFYYLTAEYILAGTQMECEDMKESTITALGSPKDCQNAIHDLDVDNLQVVIENQPSIPKGCYIYLPGNTLNFNQHPTGLTKELWSDDTRKVCHDMKIGFETAGGMPI